MLTVEDDTRRSRRGIVLSSPKAEVSNWNQYEFSMKFILRNKRLWYLLDDEPIKRENGMRVSTETVAADSDTFCA